MVCLEKEKIKRVTNQTLETLTTKTEKKVATIAQIEKSLQDFVVYLKNYN